MTACTPDPSTAAAMPAERSPSPIRRMRAPALRISPISFSWRSRSRTMTTRSSTLRSSALAIEADRVPRPRPDDQLLHVEIRRVQQTALGGGGEHGDRIRCAGRAQVGAFERIDGDVDLRQVAHPMRRLADALADVEHRRFVTLALADDDGAVDRDLIERLAHRLDRDAIRPVPVALPHRVRAGDRRL